MKIKTIVKSITPLYKFLYFIEQIIKRSLLLLKYCTLKKQNSYIYKDLVILGTGPSLKKDMDKVIEKSTSCSIMVVNSFCVDNNFTRLKPEFYVLADPNYYSENVPQSGKDDRDVFISTIKEKISWEIVLILPEIAKNSFLVKELLGNPFIKFEFINGNCTYLPFLINRFKSYNKNISMPWYQNVLQMALYYAIFKRFTNIFIFGADHNWCKDITVTEDNVVCIEENHCYDSEHCKYHPFEKEDGSYWTIGELFEAWTKTYNGYYEIKSYADYNNVTIINCSSVSFIDAFSRES